MRSTASLIWSRTKAAPTLCRVGLPPVDEPVEVQLQPILQANSLDSSASETPPRSNFGRFSLIGASEAAMSVVLPVPGRKWIASKTYLT
jgi:hypothetical protein